MHLTLRKEGRQFFRRRFLHRGQDMRVRLQRQNDICVSQPLTHYFRVHACHKKKRCARMTEIIQAYVGQLCHFQDTFEVSPVDGGDSRKESDTFSMVIRNPLRKIVAGVTATLDGGTIHSTCLACAGGAACTD